MAITGIDTIEGKQIIAAGAVSAKSAEMAYNDENGNPITGYQIAGDYYSASNPSGFITGVDLTPYQLTADMTAYQPVGNYQTAGDYLTTADSANFYTTANESGFITGVDLTPYQLTADMTAYQPAGDYLTTGDSANFYTTANESGFISEVPAGTMNESAFGYDASDNITGYNGSAFKAGDEFPQSATEAIQVVTSHSAAWDGTTETVSSNSANWGGEALPLSSRDGIDLEISGDMLYIGASALTASIDEKLDASVYATDSGNFLTTADSANFYTTANESGYLTAVPDTYLQNTDLEISDNKITGISGVPLAAGGGGDVPEGVMVESGLEYNAVDEISGYNGSAFAQYGAEKQWLVHDDTLVHASNSAQYALGVNLSAIAQLLGVDETVLFDNTSGLVVNQGTELNLNESFYNFNNIKIIDHSFNISGSRRCTIIPIQDSVVSIATNDVWFDVNWSPTASGSKYIGVNYYSANAAGNSLMTNGSFITNMGSNGVWQARNVGRLYRIIGVGRKA